MSEILIPYPEFVRDLFNRSGDPSKDFTHAILGIVTEVHEYLSATDEGNGLEELGDLAFFLEALGQVCLDRQGFLNTQLGEEGVVSLFELADKVGTSAVIADVCNTLLDDAKRWVGYGKEPKPLNEVFQTAADLVHFVNVTGPYPVIDVNKIIAANQRKLLRRYKGGKFSQRAALVRDLEAEHVALAAA